MGQSRAKVHSAVTTELAGARRISIGMDVWSKKGLTASFLGVSCAFYSPLQRKPLHVLLNLHTIAHPHTGDMLAEKLASSLKQWKVDGSKVMMVVTDNGSNMVKAVNSVRVSDEQELDRNNAIDHNRHNVESETNDGSADDDMTLLTDDDSEDEVEADDEEELEDVGEIETAVMHRLPCVAHTLQLVLKELDKVDSCKNLLVKVRGIVRTVRVSSVATEKLIQKCGKTLVTDCSTRWNSVYFMMNRMLEIKGSLNEVLEGLKYDSLTFTEWNRLSELTRLLKPFMDQTNNLQTDTLSLSCVIPSLMELSLHLQDRSFTKSFSLPLLNSLKHRFAVFLDPSCDMFDPLAASACLLDPTVMVIMLRDDMVQLLNAAKTYIHEQVNLHYKNLSVV